MYLSTGTELYGSLVIPLIQATMYKSTLLLSFSREYRKCCCDVGIYFLYLPHELIAILVKCIFVITEKIEHFLLHTQKKKIC